MPDLIAADVASHEVVAAGEQFFLDRGVRVRPRRSLTRTPQDGRFLVFVEVRRVDEATQVDFDVYQGPGENAHELINELRAL